MAATYKITERYRGLTAERIAQFRAISNSMTGIAAYNSTAWEAPVTGTVTPMPGVIPEAGGIYGYCAGDLPPFYYPPTIETEPTVSYKWESVGSMDSASSYQALGVDPDNNFYASLTDYGIMRLNDSGQWEDTNITTGYNVLGIGPDGKLYAGGVSNNILQLKDDGDFNDTNIMVELMSFGVAQDSKFYLGTRAGIKRLIL